MSYQGAAVLIDMGTSKSLQQRAGLKSLLGTKDGIHDATLSQSVENKLIVTYDPRKKDAKSVRKTVQEFFESEGPATCLVYF